MLVSCGSTAGIQGVSWVFSLVFWRAFMLSLSVVLDLARLKLSNTLFTLQWFGTEWNDPVTYLAM